MDNATYLRQWLKWHSQYERTAYKQFHKALQKSYEGLNPDNITYDNYKVAIPLNVQDKAITQAYIDVYTTIGMIHGKRVGRGINRDIKDWGLPLFSEVFQNTILDWIKVNCGERIVSVTRTMADKIAGLVEYAIGENMSVQDMQRYMREKLGDPKFTRYQALRISRSETTAASNHAALVSGETSGIVLEKVWLSTSDSRTRHKPEDQFDHRQMNNVAIAQDALFEMRSKKGVVDRLEFPGDPKGSAANVISCRCAVALRPKRDANGMVIRR